MIMMMAMIFIMIMMMVIDDNDYDYDYDDDGNDYNDDDDYYYYYTNDDDDIMMDFVLVNQMQDGNRDELIDKRLNKFGYSEKCEVRLTFQFLAVFLPKFCIILQVSLRCSQGLVSTKKDLKGFEFKVAMLNCKH